MPAAARIRRRRLATGLGRDLDLLVGANVLWGAGNGCYTYLLPLYAAELGAAPHQIGAVLALTSALQALVYLPAGLLADRLSWKRLMLAGWCLGPAAAVVFGLATAWQHLVPAVVLFASVAWCAPAYHSYIAAAADRRDLPYAFSLMFAGATVGGTLAAPLGGWLAQAGGLRWTFAGAFAGYAASTVLIALLNPRPAPPPRPGESPTQQPHRQSDAPASGAEAREPSRAAPAAARPDAQRGPRPWLRLAGRPLAAVGRGPLAGVLAATAAIEFAANLGQPLAPNWLADQYGFSPAAVGGLGSVGAAGAAALAISLGRLQRRRGGHWSLALAAAALIGYAVLLLAARTWALAAAAYALRGASNVLPSLTLALAATVLTGGAAAPPPPPPAAPRGRGAPVDGPAPHAPARVAGTRPIGLGFALHRAVAAAAVTLATVTAGWLYGVWHPLPFLASAVALAAFLAAGAAVARLPGRVRALGPAVSRTAVGA